MSTQSTKDCIIQKSNQCVACGLCLPHCPTYRLLKSEADSPRGRIALMNGVVTGRIPMNTRFIEHMDRCLTCRACEAVCPNQVAYGDLIDQTRILITEQSISNDNRRKSLLRELSVRLLLRRPGRLEALRQLLRFLQNHQWLTKIAGFRWLPHHRILKFAAQLPLVKFPGTENGNSTPPRNNWRTHYPAPDQERGSVSLFLGCVARLTDTETINSSIYVLNRLGYTVHIPPQQTCCGAIDQHSGEPAQAGRLINQNKQAFAAVKSDIIIYTSSGCGVQLQESGMADQSNNIMDINHFLAVADGWDTVNIAPLPQQILVHEPCTLRNVLRAQQYPYQCLARIPDTRIVPLAGNDQCCGAAGTYFIDQPDLADQLLQIKVAAVQESGMHYLVTTNIGCAMHIANGLHEREIRVEVLHPVTLLARQMGLVS
ncbi:MAG: (Fe-S)-binding protein [Nitrosomonas sp.]|nr:MAG: (Fe-S)-binding protein [Nitrosomonas sp.]